MLAEIPANYVSMYMYINYIVKDKKMEARETCMLVGLVVILMTTMHNAMQVSDVSQCAQIELQERNALKANSIALVWYVCICTITT